MKYRLFTFLFLCIPLGIFAQKKTKPTLLVYGADIEAFATAVQSAKSSVPTLWVIDGNQIASSLTSQHTSIHSNAHLDGGIWMELLMSIAQSKSKNDSIAAWAKKDISAQIASNSIEKIISHLPLLTVQRNTKISKITRGKRGWQVVLSDRSKHEFRTVIDASTDQKLSALAPDLFPNRNSGPVLRTDELPLASTRLIVSIGQQDGNIYGFTRVNLLNSQKDNFFTLSGLKGFDQTTNNIPLRMQYAQALGAAAAYTAFFKTTADKIDTRKLQTELMTYGARLIPHVDINIEDPHFNSFQKIYLTGIFHFESNRFEKDRKVSFTEIAPILNQLYSRSQLWFLDNKGEYLQWKDLISLVKFIGLRGEEVDKQIERDWETKLKFEGDFDPERAVTRAEFAVILDRFVNPYTVSINQLGEIIR